MFILVFLKCFPLFSSVSSLFPFCSEYKLKIRNNIILRRFISLPLNVFIKLYPYIKVTEGLTVYLLEFRKPLNR